MKRILSVFLFVGLLLVVVTPAFSYQRQHVLGVASPTDSIQIPPTTEGPGFVLPDNPFFFLDQLKQAARLSFSLNPETRARVHMAIAGERLAELRFMLAKNNVSGIETDLQGIAENYRKAALQVAEAKLRGGRDVSVLAKMVNDSIKEKQKSLDVLEEQAQGSMKAQVSATQEVLLEAKVSVEDSLLAPDFENEIKDDIAWIVNRDVKNAMRSSTQLQTDLDYLEKQAAGSHVLKIQTDVLRRAVNAKNEALKKEQEAVSAFETLKSTPTPTVTPPILTPTPTKAK